MFNQTETMWTKHSMVSEAMQRCIQECRNCASICLETVQHCLKLGGKHAEPAHIRMLMDCAEICQASANFMQRGSPLHMQTCAACAEVCKACAEDCERFNDDDMMRACAQACRRCEESCRQMARMPM
jgi:hypothetical protein